MLLPWLACSAYTLTVCSHVKEHSRANEGRLAGAHLQRHQGGKPGEP